MISDAIRKMNQNLSAKESVSSLEFSDEFDNTMARYDKTSGWHMIATPTEIAREREFNYIFNNAYNAALSAQKRLDMSVWDLCLLFLLEAEITHMGNIII